MSKLSERTENALAVALIVFALIGLSFSAYAASSGTIFVVEHWTRIAACVAK